MFLAWNLAVLYTGPFSTVTKHRAVTNPPLLFSPGSDKALQAKLCSTNVNASRQ